MRLRRGLRSGRLHYLSDHILEKILPKVVVSPINPSSAGMANNGSSGLGMGHEDSRSSSKSAQGLGAERMSTERGRAERVSTERVPREKVSTEPPGILRDPAVTNARKWNTDIPIILPHERVFPIQIGSELFRLSGASISSDGMC